MKTTFIFFLTALCMFNLVGQNTPPTLSSVSNPSIANGYSPNATYNLVVNFNENSSKRSFRLKISNSANQGVVGAASQIPSTIDTVTQSGTFYMLSDTGTAGAWNFKWTAPSSTAETITFELIGTAEDLSGGQTDVVHTCNYRVTSSTFGLTGNCSKSSQVGIWDRYENSINMEIYPNPAYDRIVIRYILDDRKDTRVEILDLGGKLVKEVFNGQENPGVRKHEALIDNWIPGLYVAKVTVGAKIFYNKISVR